MRAWLGKYPAVGALVLAYVAFVALGMPDGVLGVAWPSVRTTFALPLDAVGLLLSASVTGYLVSSLLSGPLIARWSVGAVLAASCAVTGAALIGYTLVPAWWMMVVLGVAAGLGAGAIDAGLNTHVAAHYGEGLMQWLHASYGIGATLGPVIMTWTLATLHAWQAGYRIVGGFQLLLAVCFVLTLRAWNRKEDPDAGSTPRRLTDYRTPMAETLREPGVWLSGLLFFLYAGAEGSLGTWTYTLLVGARGISPEVAGLWAGSYWATFTLGRMAAGLYAGRVGGSRLVQVGLATAALGAVLLWWNPAPAANVVAVAVVGFAIAPIFPALVSGTSRRVGEHFAANTIGLQMASASVGMAAVPSLIGMLARRLSLEAIPVCLVLVFVVLLGLHGLAQKRRRPPP